MADVESLLMITVPYQYVDCNVTGFADGSIIASFDLDIYGETEMEAVLRADIVFGSGRDTDMLVAPDGTTLQIRSLVFNGKIDSDPLFGIP